MAHADGVWHVAVRRCQESVEMSLKAALRLVSLEVPKVHDVGVFFRENSAVFPEWFQARIDQLIHISRSLRKDREVSIYGDEELVLGPQAIFSEIDATEALDEARLVVGLCQRLLQEFPQD